MDVPLDAVCQERGESFYNAMIPPLVEELKAMKSKGGQRMSWFATFALLPPNSVRMVVRACPQH